MFFDTHFHLNGEEYIGMDKDQIVKDAFDNGLVGFINVSAELGESREVVEQTLKYDNTYAAVGIHPSRVGEAKESDYKELRNLLIQYPDKIKAIGECGLDFFYEENPEPKVQIENFKKHIKLAVEFDKTLIIHSRCAFQETFDIIKEYPQLRIVIHCFTYSKEEMERFVSIGCFISFSGIVTFKNAKSIQEAAQAVPLDRLLCETDAPLLTPVPFRGKTNYTQFVKYVYEKINELRGEIIQEQVMKNVRKVFKL